MVFIAISFVTPIRNYKSRLILLAGLHVAQRNALSVPVAVAVVAASPRHEVSIQI